ncbi:MAG: glycosyltransferase family 39 protein [Anaerolineae bacterium]|nr:glycosyltransferase family 39 protein [Anaerolineae bacterium]
MKAWLSQHPRLILIAALTIGAGLRWACIGSSSLWYDETFSTLTARLSLAQILANAPHGVHPPGYYLLLHFWLALGDNEVAVRSLSALFSVGAIGLIYGFANWLFDEPTAAVAAVAMAIAPFQVYFAQEVRMYSLIVLLAIAIMWLFLYAVVADKAWLAWIGYIFVAAFGLYVHYFTAFLLIGLHLWWLFNVRMYPSKFIFLVIADALIGLLFLPQATQALTRTTTYLGGEAWQAAPSILSPLTTIYYLLFGHRAPIWVVPIALFLLLAILILTAWESRRRASQPHRFELALWLSLLTPLVTVMTISLLSPRSIYVERSFAVTSPALILLLARGSTAAPKISPTPYFLTALLFPVVVTLVTHYTTPDPAKPPIRTAVQTIESGFAPGDVSLHLQEASGLPALWYTAIPQKVIDVPGATFTGPTTHRLFGGDIVDWREATADADRLWLTVMPGYVDEAQLDLQKTLDQTYPHVMMADWGSIQLYLYDLKREP